MFRSSFMRTPSLCHRERHTVCVAAKDEPLLKNTTRGERRLHSHKVLLHLNRVKMNALKTKCVEYCDPNKKMSEQSKQCMDVVDGIKEIAEEQRELKLDYLLYILNENHDDEK